MAHPPFDVGIVVNSSTIFGIQAVSPILLNDGVSIEQKGLIDYVPLLSAIEKDIPDYSSPSHVPTLQVDELQVGILILQL